MKKTVYEIDSSGFIIGYHVEDIETTTYITADLPNGFFKPKWNGKNWVEGATQSEVEVVTNSPIIPSETEQLRLEMARSNAEIFETMIFMLGGGV